MKVSDVLQTKKTNVFAVSSHATVFEALTLMGEKNIGALLVIDNDQLVGILSERDYARKIILKGKASHDTFIKEIMTENPFTITPDDSIDTCMALMSEKHFRHLPVVADGKAVGMISIGDVVKAVIKMQKDTIDHLQNYISQ